jgi:hypothetical protein
MLFANKVILDVWSSIVLQALREKESRCKRIDVDATDPRYFDIAVTAVYLIGSNLSCSLKVGPVVEKKSTPRCRQREFLLDANHSMRSPPY